MRCLILFFCNFVISAAAFAQLDNGTECRALSELQEFDGSGRVDKVTPGQIIRHFFSKAGDTTSVRHSSSYGSEVIDAGPSTLDCRTETQTGPFPLVVQSHAERLSIMKKFGIYYAWPGPDMTAAYNGNKRCRVISGDGYLPVYLSYELIATYTKQGFDFDRLCFAFTAGQLRYDPETGARIPTFVSIAEGDDDPEISGELPLVIPNCLARSTIQRIYPDLAVLVFTGCKLNFHPWSGRKLDQWESEYFLTNPLMWVEGGAGDIMIDTQHLRADQNRRLTRVRIETITDAVQNYQRRQNEAPRSYQGQSQQANCVVADPTGTPLNIREAPGSSSKLLGTLRNGTVLSVERVEDYRGNSWAYIKDLGWVFLSYLKCDAVGTAGG